MSKGHRNQFEGAPTGQVKDVNNQNDCSAILDRVGKHETILIEISKLNLRRNIVPKNFTEYLLIAKGKRSSFTVQKLGKHLYEEWDNTESSAPWCVGVRVCLL